MVKSYNLGGFINGLNNSNFDLRVFADNNFKGLDEAIFYKGKLMACQMIIVKIDR